MALASSFKFFYLMKMEITSPGKREPGKLDEGVFVEADWQGKEENDPVNAVEGWLLQQRRHPMVAWNLAPARSLAPQSPVVLTLLVGLR